MATRGHLKKLRVGALKELAKDLSINITKKGKDELIREILDAQVPVSSLTPVVFRSQNETIFPEAKENLPPFNSVSYQKSLPMGLKISFSTIYEFMISRRTESGNNINNFNGMDRAVKHYDAGDVREVSSAQVDDSTVYVRARCYASMKKQEYNVYICATKRGHATPISIDSAYCQCPIGLAQACSHIGALLFALSNMKDGDEEPPSCTSVLCHWKAPRANAKPQPMSALAHRKPSTDSTNDPMTEPAPHPQTIFDPRHSMDRIPDLDRTLQHLQKLKEIFPKTGMVHIWNIPDPVPMASHEEEIVTTKDPYIMNMEEMLFTVGNLPPPSIDMDLVMFIEKYTQEQKKCEMWKQLHIGRITSSLFGDVLSAGNNSNSLIRQIVEGSNLER
ncbi:uncharacterized protein LOC125654037 [Ostrea edulis]|uniref:uncharacterized protein LOC125654037 n=1 Tax=Ostrea edulis TaxID=37623 RepID=UPI0024AF0CC3|nr:uncharacterized protein LOC125654037 [Ostrea edulis]